MFTVISVGGELNQPNCMRFEVDSEADLEKLPATCSPDSIAYTAGFKQIWHKANDGNWVEV